MDKLLTLELSKADEAPTSLGSGVYKIVCLSTGLFYVGGTKNLRARWKEHRGTLRRNKHSSPKLQQAFNTYGESSFVAVVLEFCGAKDIKSVEQRYLDVYKPHITGYNVLPSAQSLLGRKWSAESCLKKSIQMKGNKYGLGRKHSLETIAKICASNSRRSVSAETREKMRLKKIGKPLSDEHKAKLSAAFKSRDMAKARALSPVNKKGYVKTAEQRAKISASLVKNYENNHVLTGCCSHYN